LRAYRQHLRRRKRGVRSIYLKCPRLRHQFQCEFSVDFWFQRG